MEEQRKKGAVKLKPKPLPKRKPLTKAELDAREPPKKAKKLSPKQRAARKRRRIPKDELARLEEMRQTQQKKHDEDKKVYANLATFHRFCFLISKKGKKERFAVETYGPGPTYVPQRLLLAVLEQDRRAVDAEANLFTERSHMILSGRGAAVAVQVATPNFQSLWAGENPPIYDQVSGKGMQIGEGARF
jgi:hypothetical protein